MKIVRTARHEGGMTLIEIVITIGIIGLMVGGAITGFRSLVKSELRGTAGRLAATIRYSYDRAITTGAYYRLHFDLDEQTYKLERSDARVFLSREKEVASKDGKGVDLDKKAAEEEAEQQQRTGTTKGLPPDLLPPPSPRRAKFEDFKDSTVPMVHLKKVRILDLYTARQQEPYKGGQAYLHFFPDGHTERAVIHLGTDPADDNQYSLIVHALTGRVEIKAERVGTSSDFDGTDEAGNKKVER